jgi:hypothetical protein
MRQFSPLAGRSLPRLVWASQCVQAIVGDHETAHWLAADDMGLDDLVQIFLTYAAIPNRFGIDDHVGAVLALVKTAGLIGAHTTFESALGELGFQRFLQFSLARRVAASARTRGVADVSANEDVALELHSFSLTLTLNADPSTRRRPPLRAPARSA